MPGERFRSSFACLYVDIQLSCHHLLKSVFSPKHACEPLSKLDDYSVWTDSEPPSTSVCMPGFVSIPCLSCHYALDSIISSQVVLWYLQPCSSCLVLLLLLGFLFLCLFAFIFCFVLFTATGILGLLFKFCGEWHWDLMGIRLHL